MKNQTNAYALPACTEKNCNSQADLNCKELCKKKGFHFFCCCSVLLLLFFTPHASATFLSAIPGKMSKITQSLVVCFKLIYTIFIVEWCNWKKVIALKWTEFLAFPFLFQGICHLWGCKFSPLAVLRNFVPVHTWKRPARYLVIQYFICFLI